MGMLGRAVALLGLVLVASMFAWTASSNSAGAPQNAADGGCTCHNGQPDTAVEVGLDGFPESYAPNTTYDITVSATGGPVPVPAASQNLGGFALKVSAGLLLGDDGITITGGKFATHSSSTNDQRSWTLQWVAPETSAGPVTVTVSVNSVNGDGANAGGFDRWNKATLTVAPGSGGGSTQPSGSAASTTSGDGTPGLPFVVAGTTVAFIALLSRGRKDDA